MGKYYNDEYKPIRCKFCESVNITSRVVDTIEGITCEVEYSCKDCGERIGYWAYGYFDPHRRPRLCPKPEEGFDFQGDDEAEHAIDIIGGEA